MTIAKNRKVSPPKSIQKYIGKEWGTWAPGDRIPVDTPLSKCQRDYKEQNVFKYIKKIGGLDRNLFGYATAIRRKSDGQLALVNGQHRINLVKILSPLTTEVPAQIIDVEDEDFDRYGSRFFHQINGGVNKALTNEELFYAQVIAEDPEALAIRQALVKCQLSCGKVNNEVGTLPIKYATFVKCLALGGPATERAVQLLRKGFKSMNEVALHGLVYLLSRKEYEVLGNRSVAVGKHFETWLTQAVPMFHSVTALTFPKYHNAKSWEVGVAYGLVQSFVKHQRNQNLSAIQVGTIKEIYEESVGKDDSGVL